MPRHRSTAVVAWALTLALAGSVSTRAWAEGPADPLLKLVPPDAAMTVTVEDLSGHVKGFSGSPLAEGLWRLPAVQNWLASDRFRGFQASRKSVEALLGENLAGVRDGLLGEAVVLALRLPPGGRPEEARGLLLARVPDPAMLTRLIDGLNAASIRSGKLQRVSPRDRNGVTYLAREFRAGKQAFEYYATLHDRVFAWSNSEELIRGVIDCQSGKATGLDSVASFQEVRRRMPGRSLASVFVDPRFVEPLVSAAARSVDHGEARIHAFLGRYLGAVRYAGAAVEWKDGVILHTHEVVDPSRLPAGLKRWADLPLRPGGSPRRVPPTALVAATAQLDAPLLLDAFVDLTPPGDRPKLDTLFLALDGVLLGLDARSQVVPGLGPGVLFHADRPGPDQTAGKPPFVIEVEVGREPNGGQKLGPALDNALRTVLAVHSLDAKHGGGLLRVESRPVAGGRVTSLSAASPFAYAVQDGRLVLGDTAEAVARALAPQPDPSAGDRSERVRSAYFPEAVSFAYADLPAIRSFAEGRRPSLVRDMASRQHRPEADAARDLDQVLGLIRLFDAAFLTSSIEPGFAGVHHTLGFVKLPAPSP